MWKGAARKKGKKERKKKKEDKGHLTATLPCIYTSPGENIGDANHRVLKQPWRSSSPEHAQMQVEFRPLAYFLNIGDLTGMRVIEQTYVPVSPRLRSLDFWIELSPGHRRSLSVLARNTTCRNRHRQHRRWPIGMKRES